ncbi:MAG: hypothetical protein RBS43_04290 [Candidatus Cloacimonas sp.]|jgi:hypothetical protein|nr:hypothetical protein [Candidatus Cloacimonas sp.]
MKEASAPKQQQIIPSVSWGWFHSGAMDLVVSVVILGIGLYSPVISVLKSELIAFVVAVTLMVVLTHVFNAKVQKKLFQRIPKAHAKVSRMELGSEILTIVIILGGVIAAKTINNMSVQILGVVSLLALLIGAINSIRVKYYYYLVIALIYCVLLIRSFLGDSLTMALHSLTMALPTAWGWVFYVYTGLLFSTLATFRIIGFMKRYPRVSE